MSCENRSSSTTWCLTYRREWRFEFQWMDKPHNKHMEFDLRPAKPPLTHRCPAARSQPWWNWQKDRQKRSCPLENKTLAETRTLTGRRGGAELLYDDPETDAVSDTNTPVHVQDSATSCAGVADDHGGWKEALRVLRQQRHIDAVLLKIFQNKTTDR